MAYKKISWLVRTTGIPASTWRKAVSRDPKPFPAKREGNVWLIDDSLTEVQAYIELQQATKSKGRGRKPKTAKLMWWLVEEIDADMLGFKSLVEAQRWASKLKVGFRIYEATSKNEAWLQHQTFLVQRAKGIEFWDS